MSSRQRVFEIGRVLFKARLYELLEHDSAPTIVRWLLWPLKKLAPATDPLAARTRRALEDLGPVFIKFGQLLSTRRDLLPPAFADEFALLQDAVPPFPGETARRIVEQQLSARSRRCLQNSLTNPWQALRSRKCIRPSLATAPTSV